MDLGLGRLVKIVFLVDSGWKVGISVGCRKSWIGGRCRNLSIEIEGRREVGSKWNRSRKIGNKVGWWVEINCWMM